MRKLQKSGKLNFLSLLFGLLIGMFIMAVVSGLVIQSVTGKDVFSKLPFIIDRGKEHIKTFNKEKVTVMPIVGEKIAEKKQEKIMDPRGLRLEIHMDKNTGFINPMIYGSNLSSKAEFEMEIAKFSKVLGINNFRFPGGNSLGYRWKKSLYDFEERFDHAPLSKVENLIKFSNIAGAGIVIQVNVESGSAQEAADWVHHMNIKSNKRVEYWELGNEVYGDWDRAFMTGEEYVELIKEYSKAMRQIDPTIKIGANWGGIKYQDFDKAVAKGAFDNIDFVSYHWYPNHINKSHVYKGRTKPLAKEIMANSLAVKNLVGRFEQMLEKYAPHRKGKIEFTIMEWDGSWDGTASDLYYEYKGNDVVTCQCHILC